MNGKTRPTLIQMIAPLLTAALYYEAAAITLSLTGAAHGLAAVWVADAWLVAALLVLPPGRERLPYLLLCAVAGAAASYHAHLPAITALGFAAAHIAEAAIAAALLDRLCPARHHAASPRRLGTLPVAAALSSAIGAGIAAVIGAGTGAIADPGFFWFAWFASDTLGILTIVPAVLMAGALLQHDPEVRLRRGAIGTLAILAGVAAVNLAVFLLPPYPLTFLPLLALLLAAMWLGPVGAAGALLFTALVGSVMTAAGRGPLATGASVTESVLQLQGYLAMLYAVLAPVVCLLTNQRRRSARIDGSEHFYRSIIHRAHAAFFEIDATGRWNFVSPTWTKLIKISAEEMIGAPFANVIHPDDVPIAAAAFDMLRRGESEEAAIDVRQHPDHAEADGPELWVTARGTRMTDESGAFVGVFGTLVDITDRVSAVQARAESERLYRLLADHSNDMIFRVGLDGVRRYASPACRAVLGWEPEELVGQQALDTVHPEDRANACAIAASLLAGVEAPVAIYRQRRRDGAYAWLEATYRLVRDPVTGEPQEFVSTVRDISRRQEAELEAMEAAARLGESYRLLMMTEAMAHIGHWRLDLMTGDAFLSDEMRRILGLPLEEPPTLEAALATLHPDDRLVIEQGLRSGRPYDHVVRVVRPDGELIHIATQGQPDFAPDGRVIAMSGFVQDVTGRVQAEAKLRESEAQYRLLADHASDIIFRLDAEGRFLYVSPAGEALTGYMPEDVLGRTPLDFVHADDEAKVREGLAALHERRDDHSIVAFRFRRRDGVWQWLEANASLAAAIDGAPEIVGIARDISDRKRFEVELLRARETAERAAHEARQIAATDELTGLASRRMFMGRLVGEVTAAAATVSPLSVALLDVDHFKLVNDRFGHAAGDRVLQTLANIATRALRGHDVIGRIGGEEFAILMPNTTAEAAMLVGERLRLAVEAFGKSHSELPRVTISIGIASLPEGGDAASLLAAADYALYTAKAEGRNLLRLASPRVVSNEIESPDDPEIRTGGGNP